MKSLDIQFDHFGIDNLQETENTYGPLEPETVRVNVQAVSLNYRDYLMVEGQYNPKLKLPLIPCSDGSGLVEAVGSDVSEFKPGDFVCSHMIPAWESGNPPATAHHTTIGGPANGLLGVTRDLPAKALHHAPTYMDAKEASCLPVAGLTAFNALVTHARITPNSKVLLLGTGGVSIMGLQIAKAIGAEVILTSSSDQKLERARQLGADHIINYKSEPHWSKRVMERVPEGVDVVLEVGGDGTFDQSVNATRLGGCIALIGVLAAQNKPVNLTRVLMKQIQVQGILVGSRHDFYNYRSFLEKHQIKPVIDKVFSGLSQTQAAFRYLASGGHFGKVVITP